MDSNSSSSGGGNEQGRRVRKMHVPPAPRRPLYLDDDAPHETYDAAHPFVPSQYKHTTQHVVRARYADPRLDAWCNTPEYLDAVRTIDEQREMRARLYHTEGGGTSNGPVPF